MGLKRAKRQQLRLAMALMGPSGSGKTVSGLILAYGMMKEKYPDATEDEVWKKVGLIDTEHERALVYEGLTKGNVRIGQFWHYNLQAPYSVPRYSQAALEMKQEGVEVVVVDSLSHAWAGEGGVLDVNNNQSGKNSFSNWGDTNKEAYNPLVSFAVGETTGMHMINTIRTKQSYEMVPDAVGKPQVVKVGLKPIQRDEFEYEFQIVLTIDMEHNLGVQKDNSDIFTGYEGMITHGQGSELFGWLETGLDIFAEREAAAKKEAEERLAQAKKDEKNRQALAKTVRTLEKSGNLQIFVKSMEDHSTIKSKVEDMNLDTLKKLYAAMEQKIHALEQNAAKTTTTKGDK